MAGKQKQRSLGEMISTVCFYGVGAYFLLDGSLARADGASVQYYAGLWAAGVLCLLGGARFVISHWLASWRGRQR